MEHANKHPTNQTKHRISKQTSNKQTSRKRTREYSSRRQGEHLHFEMTKAHSIGHSWSTSDELRIPVAIPAISPVQQSCICRQICTTVLYLLAVLYNSPISAGRHVPQSYTCWQSCTTILYLLSDMYHSPIPTGSPVQLYLLAVQYSSPILAGSPVQQSYTC